MEPVGTVHAMNYDRRPDGITIRVQDGERDDSPGRAGYPSTTSEGALPRDLLLCRFVEVGCNADTLFCVRRQAGREPGASGCEEFLRSIVRWHLERGP